MNPMIAKSQIEELRVILNRWDFLGVAKDYPEIQDEYDCLIGPVLALLHQGAGKNPVKESLVKELQNHFGVIAPTEKPVVAGMDETVDAIMDWWAARQPAL